MIDTRADVLDSTPCVFCNLLVHTCKTLVYLRYRVFGHLRNGGFGSTVSAVFGNTYHLFFILFYYLILFYLGLVVQQVLYRRYKEIEPS